MKPVAYMRGSAGRWAWAILLALTLALSSCQKPETDSSGRGKEVYHPVVQPEGMSVPS